MFLENRSCTYRLFFTFKPPPSKNIPPFPESGEAFQQLLVACAIAATPDLPDNIHQISSCLATPGQPLSLDAGLGAFPNPLIEIRECARLPRLVATLKLSRSNGNASPFAKAITLEPT